MALFASAGTNRLVFLVNIMICLLQVKKCREADVRKLGAVLIISTAIAVAASPHSALAKADKSSANLLKHTATGKHFDKTTLTPHNSGGSSEPSKTVAKKPATSTAADKTTKPFIKLEGIKGESKDKDHKDWLD